MPEPDANVPAPKGSPAEAVIDLYERRATEFDRDRGRSLFEKYWLDRFLELLPTGATVLDIGCGMGEPIARYLIDSGVRLTGVDASPTMIRLCEQRFPGAAWILGDMRRLALGRRFDGLVAWDSFFHLAPADQRAMFERFASHANDRAALLFTSGDAAGEVIGDWYGERLYHASLAPAEYRDLLDANGFRIRDHRVEDPEYGGHTIWLASRR
jgi:cyclopropane fatty-acyl-phospholipid synthase-like methyltransferase